MRVFENPAYLRCKIHDMETGENTARLQDRWAYVGSDGLTYTHPTKEGATRFSGTHGEALFALIADYDTKISTVRSTDEAALRMMGEAHHNAATIKPNLTLIDPTGKTIATMDVWALEWAEVTA